MQIRPKPFIRTSLCSLSQATFTVEKLLKKNTMIIVMCTPFMMESPLVFGSAASERIIPLMKLWSISDARAWIVWKTTWQLSKPDWKSRIISDLPKSSLSSTLRLNWKTRCGNPERLMRKISIRSAWNRRRSVKQRIRRLLRHRMQKRNRP